MNRLTEAGYYEQSVFPGNAQHTENFDVTLSYDANGNIGSLERHGLYGTSSFGKIDDLSYLYTGNQLRRVTDNSSVAQTAGVTQFRDGTNIGDDYGYDGNGNLDSDENKEIQAIAYNHFNKPTKITYTDGREIRYYYSADGTKLRQTVHTYRTVDEITPTLVISKRSDYLGAIHYEDAGGDGTTSSLEITFIQHEEGRYRPNGSEMIYEYNLTDHLGNTRITFGDADDDGLPEILQENHYYPFGMAMTMSSTLAAAPPNNYLYNGKELQDELDLGWYDYGARMYDASIGRWNGVDALADSFLTISPFAYVANNPINSIDPDGDSIIVLTAPMGAGGFGHAAILISDPSKPGEWLLYSSNGGQSSSGASGEQYNPDRGTPVGTLNEFWNSEHSMMDGEPYYTEGYLLPTDQPTDEKMQIAALEVIDDDYGLVTNSCIDVCSKALERGGFDKGGIILGYVTPEGPNARYALIKRNNPGGTVKERPRYINPQPGSYWHDLLGEIMRTLNNAAAGQTY